MSIEKNNHPLPKQVVYDLTQRNVQARCTYLPAVLIAHRNSNHRAVNHDVQQKNVKASARLFVSRSETKTRHVTRSTRLPSANTRATFAIWENRCANLMFTSSWPAATAGLRRSPGRPALPRAFSRILPHRSQGAYHSHSAVLSSYHRKHACDTC